MQSTGTTPSHARVCTQIHGSAMMFVTSSSPGVPDRQHPVHFSVAPASAAKQGRRGPGGAQRGEGKMLHIYRVSKTISLLQHGRRTLGGLTMFEEKHDAGLGPPPVREAVRAA